jgi:eukaryotic-like serine/threonine-protein kinase
MTPEEWQRVRPILESALELSSTGRTSFLDSACTDDFLRREVESLLKAHDRGGNVLQPGEAARKFDGELDETRFLLPAGKRIGKYEIGEEIARGGMGAVYRAIRADGQYNQHVALKIVRAELGWEFNASRFLNERQILATLDHPNIAKILDGGTADGIPYFVMEFIDGLPVTSYCDKHSLDVEARLRTFRTVCAAAYYAHQHLVIHRDIKPTNILVTPDGIPKLLDFGIAKILDPSLTTEDTALNASVLWPMTPEYAAPEQLRGETITTATDVYSLGLVLYEILTGQAPYHFRSRMPQDVARTILQTEVRPPSAMVRQLGNDVAERKKPSFSSEQLSALRGGDSPQRLQRRLHGDLDNIVLKAIRKDPTERYSSVEQFSDDIRRYLERLPVTATKDTLRYRVSKFVSRRKASVLVAVCVVLILVVGVTAVLYEARIANVQRMAAEKRLRETRKLTESVLVELPVALDNGATGARELIDQKALEYLNEAAADMGADSQLAADVALGYINLAEAHGHPAYAHTGDAARALEEYKRAIHLLENELASNPNNDKLRYSVARSYIDSGLALLGIDVSQTVERYRHSLAILAAENDKSDSTAAKTYHANDLLLEQGVSLDPGRLRWADYELLGEQYGSPYYANLGDSSKAKEYIEKAIPIAQRFYEAAPNWENTYHLYYSEIAMAGILWVRGDLEGALSYQKKAEILFDSMGAPTASIKDDLLLPFAPYSQSMRDERALAMVRRANLLAEAGQMQAAQQALQNSREILERLYWGDARNSAVRRDLTRNYNLTGDILLRTGDLPGALRNYQQAFALGSESLTINPNQPEVRHRLADSYQGLGSSKAAMGRTEEALQDSLAAVSIRESLAQLDQGDARYKASLAASYITIADLMKSRGQTEAAMDFYDRSRAILGSLLRIDPLNALAARQLRKTQDRRRPGTK